MAVKRKASSNSESPNKSRLTKRKPADEECRFIGEPVDKEEALRRWPHRYLKKKGREADASESPKFACISEENHQAKRHYTKAKVDGVLFKLGDHAHVQAEEGMENYICRIEEMFEGLNCSNYITARWFYRAKDTVIESCDNFIEGKRIFLSVIRNDNPLDCLVGKINIVQLPLSADMDVKKSVPSKCDYYYDMLYLVPYSSFVNLPHDTVEGENGSDSEVSCEAVDKINKVTLVKCNKKSEMKLLDLYSGCGAMSTGLCLGTNLLGGLSLSTKWAVDINKDACDSLKLNHPEAEVRNERAEDFLCLLKKWEGLCSSALSGSGDSQKQSDRDMNMEEEGNDDSETNDEGEFEVEKILSICYGDPKENGKLGLYFKIRWKGYGEDEDTWEPEEGLSDCQEKINAFVIEGYKSNILPLPGNVDVLCGGPPCQGISGFNRFRNEKKPLDDEKNKQVVVFMDIVEFLKPNFVLMENVVDILKFSGGFLARYALGRLVGANYQARLGMMVAGSYGLPQFRRRMFLWGACQTERLPQFPLPTHKVNPNGAAAPTEFLVNIVDYKTSTNVDLEEPLLLGDAIEDLPPVNNTGALEKMPYGDKMPTTDFQKFIRLRKDEMLGSSTIGSGPSPHLLFDHQPLELSEDDYQRVCLIPKKKGANFRDLPGLRFVGKKVELDPNVERPYLPSKKPLVPDYAISYRDGNSTKPFRRLWWDEIVSTVVTRAEPHNQAILHPTQDRVLTIRENARLQGFPDYYKLSGEIKERYIQVGNAVAVPVARALGYALALACNGSSDEGHLLRLPNKFPLMESTTSELDEDS